MIENYLNTKKIIETIHLRIEAIEHVQNSFTKEKETLLSLKEDLNLIINKIEIHLGEMKGIEHKLYYEIVVNGLNPNKAVEKVSMYNDISVSAIWKNYYPKVKEKIRELKN